jgi:hypothetical protein
MKHLLHNGFLLMFISLWIIAGCASMKEKPRSQEGYIYSGVSFEKDLSDTYKKGVRDGCETSKGYYTKNHRLFNDDNDYYHGWFTGRNRCRHLLVLEEG